MTRPEADARSWLARLQEAWTRNDGKAREDWAPGRDLKETVMIVALGVLVLIQIGLGVWMLVE